MLRIYFLQQWHAPGKEALEDAICDRQARRSFAGIELSVEAVPDATTLLKFRHLLEEFDLTAKIFSEVAALLGERKLLMREATIVDATIIAAPSACCHAGMRTSGTAAQNAFKAPRTLRSATHQKTLSELSR